MQDKAGLRTEMGPGHVEAMTHTLYLEAPQDKWKDLFQERVRCMQTSLKEIFPEGKPMEVEEVLVPIVLFRVSSHEDLRALCEILRVQIQEFLKDVTSKHGFFFTYDQRCPSRRRST